MLKLSGGQLTEDALELLCECAPSSSAGGEAAAPAKAPAKALAPANITTPLEQK